MTKRGIAGWALLSGLLLLPAGANDWETKLEVTEGGLAGFYPGIGARADGSAAVLCRGTQTNDASRPYFASLFRTYQDGSWTAPVAVDAGLPTYATTYGNTVKMTFEHYVCPLPGDGGWVLGAAGRYSTSTLTSEGTMYALFLRTMGATLGPWKRVTPVGRIYQPSVAFGADGLVWFAWSGADNLNAGNVQLSSFDPSNGAIGGIETVDSASMQPQWQTLEVVAAPGGDIWVTYRAPDGLYARVRKADGTWDPRIQVSPSAAAHEAAWSGGTLWVVAALGGGSLYRLQGGQFVLDAGSIFNGWANEDETLIESVSYWSFAVAARPEGGVAVTASRAYYYEMQVAPYTNTESYSFVARERDAQGQWSSEHVVDPAHTFSPPDFSMTSSAAGIWFAGGSSNSPLGLQIFFRAAGSSIGDPGDTGAALPCIEKKILEFVNGPATTQAELETAVKLGFDSVAPGAGDYAAKQVSASIVAKRPFASLKALYETSGAGPESMEGLEIYVGQKFYGLVGPSSVLAVTNDAAKGQAFFDSTVGLKSDAAKNLIRYREGGPDLKLQTSSDNQFVPFPRVFGTGSAYQDANKHYPAHSVDDVPEVGPDSIQRIFDWAMANGG
ncbi:MAG: hypothetical protein HYY17_01715 [Planctomycetes bacterium]|nr:hypothetical protein [Planctomycetota bacterium]